ncbi:ATPase [Methylobacterium sp. Leaf456]|uniref:hybrid sensor histidine kinase/response regulator n=1 Tax=Methylobacterium sp. Leaf456 TaxID=1736382 RepID=UPI0006FCB9C7|nr:ATP-binding protein [Methylobacterium sp. Leaf456]KQT49154.1 ATPase [Methylobacterium sp. Leaf456]
MRVASLNPLRSLAGRLALIVAGAVTGALLLATGLSAWREVDRYAADKREALRMTAQVIAAAAAGATARGDEAGALATLRAVAGDGAVIYAAIEDGNGILAEQGIGLRLSEDIDLDRGAVSPVDLMTTRTLRVTVPVIETAREVGRVVIVSDSRDLAARIGEVAGTALLAGLLALVLGLAVSLRLQRSVTRPLAALATTMDGVRRHHDYTQRAAIQGGDEVEGLAKTFNALLGAVNERDRAIAEHGAGLEREVALRTADLFEAKQSADAANTAKSTFLATMSHEIRTPMNGMLVMAELLANAELPPRQQRYAKVIARSGQSLLAIINDILDFAKVEAGKLEVERIPVSPRDVADTVVTLFGERARSAGLDLAAQVAPDVPAHLLGDPVRLGQVLGNFVSNALKFTSAGHVLVRMEMEGAWLRIAVTDTGIGIPDDKLGQIFTAFSQADQSTTRRFGGTGLGLSIAERLIAAMGGHVGVESRVGEGSTFWARIPVEGAVPAEPTTRLAAGLPDMIALGVIGSATRAVLEADLTAAGFRLGAESGAYRIAFASELADLGRRRDPAARIVALVPIGDPAGPDLLERGLADELMRWPLVQSEWRPVLTALATGTPFTAIAPAREAEARPAALPSFAGARVLVADDSAVNREVATEALSRLGVNDVTCVEDGAAAVSLSASRPFDLILMDGSMPVLDGFAASLAIRTREAETGTARVPIVALTAHVVGEGAVAWQAAGMDGMLAKPFTLAQLAAVLARHVAEQEATEQPPLPETAPAPAAPVGALLDEQTLANLDELGDRDFVAHVLRLYARQAPGALADLETALGHGDAPAAARAAHSLKSMSANIGAARMKDTAGAIEASARAGAAMGDATMLPALLAETLVALAARIGAPEMRAAG